MGRLEPEALVPRDGLGSLTIARELDETAASLPRTADGSLTFDGIADLAGVSPTLPYKYFGSVDELATELTTTRLVAPPHPTLVRARLADPGAVA